MGKAKMTYDEAMERLTAAVAEIESGELSISGLTAKTKEAMELVKFCKSQLNEVQEEIEKIFSDEPK